MRVPVVSLRRVHIWHVTHVAGWQLETTRVVVLTIKDIAGEFHDQEERLSHFLVVHDL